MIQHLPPPGTRKAPDRGLLFNRLSFVLVHVPWYSIEGQARLATDTFLSQATVSRIICGINNASTGAQSAIADAISYRLKIPIVPCELFSPSGFYPTMSCCQLCGCTGCLPPWAWDEDTDELLPAWEFVTPGVWSLAPGTAPKTLVRPEKEAV